TSITSEEELFKFLGLHFIPPELREGQGEIDAAEIAAGKSETGRRLGGDGEANLQPEGPVKSAQVSGLRSQVFATGLPRLVEESDIRGVFHNHTTASDGHNTLEE